MKNDSLPKRPAESRLCREQAGRSGAQVGIDEVGRGCWAGPLVAGAVLLDKPIEGLRDSKKLSKKRREALAETIRNEAKAYGVGWVSADEVDQMGLSKAVQLAMLRAMKRLQEFGVEYDEIIIDGNLNFFANVQGLKTANVRTEIRADDTVPAVSAASILAKVERDTYMAELAQKYPEYGFEAHVGYGTAKHILALQEHGPIKTVHRFSYAPVAKLLDILDPES